MALSRRFNSPALNRAGLLNLYYVVCYTEAVQRFFNRGLGTGGAVQYCRRRESPLFTECKSRRPLRRAIEQLHSTID
jgi:hypothetical protein